MDLSLRVVRVAGYVRPMGLLLCLLLSAGPLGSGPGSVPDSMDEVEEEVRFDETEEEVDFGNESTSIQRVELPDVEYRPWLIGLPCAVVLLLAWNVRWRKRQRGATQTD